MTDSPLADLPAWRVSQLTGFPVRRLALYRKAFTHSSALQPARKTAQVRAARHAVGAAAGVVLA